MVLTSSSVWTLGRLPALVGGGVHSGHLSDLRCPNACVTRTRRRREPAGAEGVAFAAQLHRVAWWTVRGGEGSGRRWARGRAWVFNK